MGEHKEFISAAQIAARVRELAAQVEKDYEGLEFSLVCVLKGSVVFTADLARAINRDVRMDFIDVSSYGDSMETSGKVKINMDLAYSVEGQHIIVIEDIVDTGLTLSHLVKRLKAQNPASIRLCALLDKPSRRRAEDLTVDYVGFEIPDKFVVGYGMDYAQRYRNLPYIAVIEGNEAAS